MIRGLEANREQFLLNLGLIENRARRAQMQLTTGYRINQASDAPGDVMRLTDLHVQIGRATQSITNFERVKSDVDTNEATIRTAIQIVEQVKVAGARGVDDLASPEERAVLAARVRSWHSELVRLADRNHGGRYQFAGDLDGVAPYTLDWSQPAGVVRNHNAEDTRLLEDMNGDRFSVSRRAQDIFDLRDSTDAVAVGNVFNAVYELARGLEDNDLARISTGLDQVEAAADHLNNELMLFGAAQNRVTDAINQAKQAELRFKTALGEVRDADIPAAILELTQSTTSLEAAMGAQQQSEVRSLFDYLG
jgi:flagellin-like hook-associated protein FlgL